MIPTISKSLQAEQVERFVVVHGQILLNQFQHFPSKAVKDSAFASSLRSAMETRRHSKLFMGAGKSAKAGGHAANRNPMKVRRPSLPHPPFKWRLALRRLDSLIETHDCPKPLAQHSPALSRPWSGGWQTGGLLFIASYITKATKGK